jgi:hypothetical protein
MNVRQIFIYISAAVRRNPRAWALFGFGAFMPFVVFGCSGYFGFPDWRHSWFDSFQVPLMALGLLCCVVAPFLAAGSIWRRLSWAGLSLFGFAAATFVASISTLVAFGLPMD